MLSGFEKKVADFIEANELFADSSKLLLAVSGGADSIALLYAMQTLKEQDCFSAGLHCAHINHQLRAGQADNDEDFVVAQAAKLQLGLTTKRIHVREFARENKLSIETAARKLRMQNLIDIAGADNCSHIVTAHQKDDNAETVLHHLLRGTGFRGLAGIWPVRKFNGSVRLVRPLLCVTRDEILAYLRQKKLQWCEDLTNADCRYTRNYIRHRLIPVLQHDCRGPLVEQLCELSESARRFHQIVCRHADNAWPEIADCAGEKMVLNLELFSRQSQPVRVELLRRSFAHIGCGQANITQQHYQGILKLAEQNATGRMLKLPDGFIVRREYGNLIFRRVGLASPKVCHRNKVLPVPLKIPGQITFDKFLIKAIVFENNETEFEKFKSAKTVSVEWFDLGKITQPLVVRFRKAGDKFVPLGQTEEKRVGKFLTAQKVPHDVRQKVLVIEDGEKIIWLWPIRIGEPAKINGKTRKILQLQITKIE